MARPYTHNLMRHSTASGGSFCDLPTPEVRLHPRSSPQYVFASAFYACTLFSATIFYPLDAGANGSLSLVDSVRTRLIGTCASLRYIFKLLLTGGVALTVLVVLPHRSLEVCKQLLASALVCSDATCTSGLGL